LESAGGESYIYALAAAVPDASAVENHVKLLHEKYLLRKLIQECNDIIRDAYQGGIEVQELLDRAERNILQLDQNLPSGRIYDLDAAIRSFIDTYEIEEIVDEFGRIHTTLKKPRGLETGYVNLDRKLGGLKPGDLIIVAARPGVGKTALILNFAHSMAAKGHRVGLFSLEMSKEQVALRLLAMTTGIPSDRLDQGNFTREEIQILTRRYGELSRLPIYIDDTSVLNIRALKNRARRLWAQHRVEIIFVDYLQLMEGLTPGEEGGRVQEVTEISRGLKQIARELQIPVVACSQLSRKVEQRSMHRPILSDLRESGSLEQDADVVILMYREDYYDKQRGEVITSETAEMGSRVEINVAKHRNGPTGFVYLTYLHPFLRFEVYGGEDVPLPEY